MFTILLVDDNSDLRQVFQLVLENAGYHVLTASDGKEGVQTAIAHLPDVILTDWDMPELDGRELCREVRQHAVLGSTPIGLISARDPPVQDPTLWTRIVRKPVGIEALTLTVAQLLAGRLPRTSVRPFQSDPARSRWAPVPSRCWP
jgi:CheY-like chemotaxis protein